jgi:Holliday junction DNA helicase RuvA
MISRIAGKLVDVTDAAAHLRCGHLTYEVLVPACALPTLQTLVNSDVELCTREILESNNQGASFVPRLIGFTSSEEREFFELLTKVKGIGYRKALRAMRERDLALLKSLPEIGGRMAETILTELKGKVDRFVEAKPAGAAGAAAGKRGQLATDAMTVLIQLGESRTTARSLIDRALAADPEIDSPDLLVTASLRLKELG